jgi:uncharacterized membrane protein YdbT with pleckstrin-like domain
VPRYIDRNLQSGETETYRGRPSKTALFIRPLLFGVGFIVADSIARAQSTAKSTTTPGANTAAEAIFALIAVFCIVAAIATVIGASVFLRSAEYAVTDRRVIAKYGLFRRRTVDTLLRGVSSVVVNQSAFGRMCGYGNLLVRGAGGDRSISWVKDPKGFQSAILSQLDSARLLKGTAAYTLNVKPAQEVPVTSSGESSSVPTTAVPLPPGTPAHWAADPFDLNSVRYWDGNRWTEHVAPAP